MRELKITKKPKMSNIEMAKAQANADENEVSGVPVKKHDVKWDDASKAAYDQEILRITKVKKPAPKKAKASGVRTLKEKNDGIKSFLDKRYNTGGEKQLELQKSEMKGTYIYEGKDKYDRVNDYEVRIELIKEDIFNQDGKATEQQKKDMARLKQAMSELR
jgi:hypothetical protein